MKPSSLGLVLVTISMASSVVADEWNFDVNGKPTAVSGAPSKGGFIVEKNAGQELLPDGRIIRHELS